MERHPGKCTLFSSSEAGSQSSALAVISSSDFLEQRRIQEEGRSDLFSACLFPVHPVGRASRPRSEDLRVELYESVQSPACRTRVCHLADQIQLFMILEGSGILTGGARILESVKKRVYFCQLEISPG